MPKRIVDGEALWLSTKVSKLPKEYRMHYANWVPLAEANGVFEADPARIHARIYAFLLPEMTVKRVQHLLKLMVDAGLIYTWEQDGKTWGFFIGMQKKGRLPGHREIGWYKNLPPAPPSDAFPDED